MNIPIHDSEVQRVAYRSGQLLDARDFELEQGFHIAARRRHVLGLHDWGIVDGLELRVAQTERQPGGSGTDARRRTLTLHPGLAIDGYGRELVVAAPLRVESSLLDRVGWDVDALTVQLHYARERISEASDRYPRGDRWLERPIVRVLECAAHEIPDRPDDRSAIRAHRAVGDDRLDDEWTVPLGTLKPSLDNPGELVVDGAARRLVGLVARELASPGGETRLSFGDDSLLRVSTGETEPLVIERDGSVRVRDALQVGAYVAIDGGRLSFDPDASHDAMPAGCRIRRVDNALRIELPDDSARLLIRIPDEQGEPVDVLEVSSRGVTVTGNFEASGTVTNDAAAASDANAAATNPAAPSGGDSPAGTAGFFAKLVPILTVLIQVLAAFLLVLLAGRALGLQLFG